MFEFMKASLFRQRRIRDLVSQVVHLTNEQMPLENEGEEDSIIKFIRPMQNRFDFDPVNAGLPEDLSFEVFIFYRTFYNPDLQGFKALNLHQYHILFQLLEHEMNFTETEVHGINLKFVLFSEVTCSNMSKFLRQMHRLDLIPLTHPNGYRQVMFQDYRNIFGHGHNALFLHTSPHKQYYIYIAPSLEVWL